MKSYFSICFLLVFVQFSSLYGQSMTAPTTKKSTTTTTATPTSTGQSEWALVMTKMTGASGCFTALENKVGVSKGRNKSRLG